jgi:hypothetical protein
MGDYRYFPEHPAPIGGSDAYGRPLAVERRAGLDAGQGRGYAPPQPALRQTGYTHDPYGADPYAADPYGANPYDAYDAGDQPYAAYVPPQAQAPYTVPPAPHGGAYAPQGYRQPPRVAEPVHAARGRQPHHAAPSWIKPQGAYLAAEAPDTAKAAPIRPAALLHGLGAVMSLGLVVLAGAWTWGMMQRDVSGVPVVRALEGPMRVAPETPGGQQAAFQGLAVNALAGSGASPEADVIVLAPQPLGLGELAAVPVPPEVMAPGLTIESEIVTPVLGFNNPTRLAVATSPRPRGRDAAGMQFAAATAPQPAVSMPALSTSNDPRAADALAASIAQSVAQDLAGPRGIDVDPASIGPGTRLVQLGAYDNADEARTAWDALSRRFSPLLNDRGRVIEAAHSGGSVFFRLRAHGFSDERDARRFCAALVAEQIDCIPVLVR